MMSRECTSCAEQKDIIQFGKYKTNAGKSHYRRICNSCRRSNSQKRYKENPAVRKRMKHTAKAWRAKKTYGISLERYEELVNHKDSVCKICNKNQSNSTLNLDHCHITGRIRGVLCWDCNTALGKFKDDINLLTQAIKYLQESCA